MSRTVGALELKGWLGDGGELAILDVREEGVFGKGHLLFAVCLPLSRLELRIRALVPRLGTRIALCDGGAGDGDGLAATAAERLAGFGYSEIAILESGTQGWREAGLVLFSGVNVPCKAFGEMVEHQDGTQELGCTFYTSIQESGKAATIMRRPPKKQVSRDHRLEWKPQDPPENVHELFEAIRRVRNNLVHGGKSGAGSGIASG